MKPLMLKLGFLASNNGSQHARHRRGHRGRRTGRRAACLVVSNRKAAPALAFARRARRRHAVHPDDGRSRRRADARLAAALSGAGAELVILSGYLRKLGPGDAGGLRRPDPQHPSGACCRGSAGQGMYGRRVHEAVVAAGEHETGATVHLVDDEYDHGAVIAQVRLTISPGETAESVERRVMAAEPRLFVETLQNLGSGSLTLPGP